MDLRNLFFNRVLPNTKIVAVIIASASAIMFMSSVVVGFFLLHLIIPDPYPYLSKRVGLPEVTVLEDGWQKVVTEDVELCLPPTFVLLDPEEVLQDWREHVSRLPKSLSGALILSGLVPISLVIGATDERATPSGLITNVMVVREQVVSAIDTERVMNLIARKDPAKIVFERSIAALAHYDAGRLALKGKIGARRIIQVHYVVKTGSTMWSIVFTTAEAEYAERQPEFERSADCFLFRRDPPPTAGTRADVSRHSARPSDIP